MRSWVGVMSALLRPEARRWWFRVCWTLSFVHHPGAGGQYDPDKIPVYRGLLGLRLLLVKRSRKAELSHIGDFTGLAKLVGLHGSQWGDLPVYACQQKLPVVTHVNYTSLFHMLIAGRADYFHRGISEITGS